MRTEFLSAREKGINKERKKAKVNPVSWVESQISIWVFFLNVIQIDRELNIDMHLCKLAHTYISQLYPLTGARSSDITIASTLKADIMALKYHSPLNKRLADFRPGAGEKEDEPGASCEEF